MVKETQNQQESENGDAGFAAFSSKEMPETNPVLFRKGEPFLIAGPCSAESEMQLQETARALSEIPGIRAMRAGIWKPRTRPNSFEGHGKKALDWLINAGKENGLMVCTEVATAQHAEEALRAGIHILWIGARTTVSPFSVQEIAEALRGTSVPVMVKNPVNPDLSLWVGAVERLENAGIKEIAAIHRGFSTYGKSQYRNAPEWAIPIEFRRQKPHIPLLCDPSHIAGKRSLIAHLSQKALDLDYAGLMIETHPRPDEALSDSKQQLKPSELARLLNGLHFSCKMDEKSGQREILELLRTRIDTLDRQLLETLAERMEVVGEIAEMKKATGMSVLQIDRWAGIFENRIEAGLLLGLNETLIRRLIELVHLESIGLQGKIIRGED
jgi:chorismate mutase